MDLLETGALRSASTNTSPFVRMFSWIISDERSGLLTRIATESVERADEKLTAFVELERSIYEFAVDLIS